MPKLNVWDLWSRLAANTARFEASAEVAETAALYVICNHLARAQDAAQLRAISDIVGPEAIAAAVDALSPWEAARILTSFDPKAVDLKPSHARVALAAFILSGQAHEAPAPPARQMRRHKAIGARRIRGA
jgi:hypothetical protein